MSDTLDTAAVLDGYLHGNEGLAKALGKSRRTVERWKSLGEVPPYSRLGKEILYHVDDVREWLRSRRIDGEAA